MVGVIGLAFLCAGLIILSRYARAVNASQPHPNKLARFILLYLEYLMTATLLTAFAIVPSWFAFGPGGGESSGSISIFFFTIPIEINQLTTRILAGGGAIILIAIAISAWISGLRNLRSALFWDEE